MTMFGGTLALVRLLPAVSRRKTAVFAGAVLIAAAAPVTITVLTGLLIGSIPATVRSGFDSGPGRHTVHLLAAVAALILLQRALTPIMLALATTLGRGVDRHLQERVMAAVGAPTGVSHLEDPDVLDRIRIARGLGMGNRRPSRAVEGL